MSIFTDYLKTRQQQRDGDWGIPQPSPAQPAAPQQPLVSQPAPQQPQVDTNNAMASIADMMGPTPVEREAQERKLQKQRAQWAAWTGVFDGLRQLGNLYYTYKGATPQKFDNPYTALNSEIQQQRAIQDNLNNYRRNYATSLYNMQRQMNDDARRKKLTDAQAGYYDTRGELARLKGENDRLKAEQQIAVQKARQEQIETKTKQLQELHPLQKRKLEAVIKNTLHNANRPYGGGRGGSRGSGSYDPFTELAMQLNDNPDTIGPILQQEGLGFYDEDSKEFTFNKNATKGMATTAVKRARNQGTPKGTTQQKPATDKYKNTRALGL